MLSNVGAGGSAPAASSAPAAAAAGGDAPAAEKAVEKVEEKEESDDDMVSLSFTSLFDEVRRVGGSVLIVLRNDRVSGSSINQPIHWKLIKCAIHLRFTVVPRRTSNGDSERCMIDRGRVERLRQIVDSAKRIQGETQIDCFSHQRGAAHCETPFWCIQSTDSRKSKRDQEFESRFRSSSPPICSVSRFVRCSSQYSRP